jgi:hypothetical protein
MKLGSGFMRMQKALRRDKVLFFMKGMMLLEGALYKGELLFNRQWATSNWQLMSCL